nr:unnamed protein product [Callosobruchus chinensis]
MEPNSDQSGSPVDIVTFIEDASNNNNVKKIFTGEIDAVYIPPEVDTLTDENDDMNPRESEEPIDIVGTCCT